MKQTHHIFAKSIKVVLANLLFLLLILLAVELFFGNWFGGNTDRRLNRLNIIRDTQTLIDVSHLYDRPASSQIRYTRDKYGLRGEYEAVDQIDILTIGGSTTDQRAIDDSETWQAVLQRRFEIAGEEVFVVSAGVDGQSTVGHHKDFDWWFPEIPGLDADYMLLYVGINDFAANEEGFLDFDIIAADESETARRAASGLARFKRTFQDNSALYQLYRVVWGIIKAQRLTAGHYGVEYETLTWTREPRLNAADHQALTAQPAAAYGRRLQALGERIEAFGSQPICLTQPSRRWRVAADGEVEGAELLFPTDVYGEIEMNGLDYYHMFSQFNATTLAVCRANGWPAFDLANEIEWEDADFYDFFHNTPQGAEKIGLYLFEKLDPLLDSSS